jgi:hypothetical protein
VSGLGLFFLIDDADFIYYKKFKYALFYLDFVLLTNFIIFGFGNYYTNHEVGYPITCFMTAVFLVLGSISATTNFDSFSILF